MQISVQFVFAKSHTRIVDVNHLNINYVIKFIPKTSFKYLNFKSCAYNVFLVLIY